MKKIKFFALAAFAMLSTNAFAAPLAITSGAEQTIGGIKYTVTAVYAPSTASATNVNTVTAEMNSFSGTKITIPATVQFNCQGTNDSSGGTGVAFNLENATFLVTAIKVNGFTGLTNVTELEIGENVQTIGAGAFAGCKNLATVTLAEGSWLNSIGDGAFAYTSVEELDLSNATAFKAVRTDENATGMTVFGDVDTDDYGPFTSATYATNIMISKVVLPTTCATVSRSAFKDCSEFSEIDLTNVTAIGQSAFSGTALTEVAIGTAIADNKTGYTGIAIGANAFYDCAKLATVEVGKIDAGTIDDAAFGVATHYAGVTTFKFNTIAAALGTTAWNLGTVKTIYFQKYIGTADFVPANSFINAFPATGGANTIYYNEITVEGDAALGINAAAFAAAATASRTITLKTIEKVQTAYGSATAIHKVTIEGDFSGSFIIGYGDDKKLAKDKNSNSYYYFVKAPAAPAAKDLEIEKTQENGAKVSVYQAYTDEYKSVGTLAKNDIVNIYMVPLKVSGGKYVVLTGQTVIIKSDKEEGVKATPITTGGATSMIYDDGGLLNKLAVTAEAMSALDVKTGAGFLNSGANDVWFFNNPTASGFGFTKYDQTKQKGLSKDCVYIQTALSTASARVNIVWLDEEGATAIQSIKTKAAAQNGAIYNLAGQKVNAAYKGVVIKDGKKYIQK